MFLPVSQEEHEAFQHESAEGDPAEEGKEESQQEGGAANAEAAGEGTVAKEPATAKGKKPAGRAGGAKRRKT